MGIPLESVAPPINLAIDLRDIHSKQRAERHFVEVDPHGRVLAIHGLGEGLGSLHCHLTLARLEVTVHFGSLHMHLSTCLVALVFDAIELHAHRRTIGCAELQFCSLPESRHICRAVYCLQSDQNLKNEGQKRAGPLATGAVFLRDGTGKDRRHVPVRCLASTVRTS